MTTTTTTPIKDAATAFTLSYARAMHLADPTTSAHATDIPLIAAALGAHYAPQLTAYTHGHRGSLGDDAAAAGIAAHLERFERAGLGFDIRLARYRVEVVSEGGCALCWLTWRIHPRAGGGGEAGVEGWEWENVYAYRRGGAMAAGAGVGAEEKQIGGEEDVWVKPEGLWEFIVSDNEMQGLFERVPNFMEL